MKRSAEITTEIVRRADEFLSQKFLVVDYYRIRRRFAYPLPLQAMNAPQMPVSNIVFYPWAIWMAWQLEERILSLGWAAQWTGEPKYSDAATRDLEALTLWPRYSQLDSADLAFAHLSRLFVTVLTKWAWLPPVTREKVEAALHRMVAETLPAHRAHYGDLELEEVLSRQDVKPIAHNVAFIGALGVALAAHTIGDSAEMLDADIAVLIAALLALREKEFSEGACYDGHVLDFIADWLAVLPDDKRATHRDDARWASFFEEVLHLSAPGDAMNLAPLSDVEPQYTLHINAQIKMHALQSAAPPPEFAAREWYLGQLDLKALRVDGLTVLQSLTESSPIHEPARGVSHAHYARVLRSGWGHNDVAVTVAASNSPMNHIRADYGSLCIGSGGHWLIQTPGYQQYIQNSEREWTIGKTARNTPLIKGYDASIKAGQVVPSSDKKLQVTLDLCRCYESELGLQSLTRRVELLQYENKATVFVEDRIAPQYDEVVYHWHGHPDAAWWVENDWAMIHLQGQSLWVSCPQTSIHFENVQRLRGSRGPLTLVASIERFEASAIQWFFVFSDEPPAREDLLRVIEHEQRKNI